MKIINFIRFLLTGKDYGVGLYRILEVYNREGLVVGGVVLTSWGGVDFRGKEAYLSYFTKIFWTKRGFNKFLKRENLYI